MASTIRVDALQDTGGNNIITSDSAGTFTYNGIAASAIDSGTLAIAQGGTGAATLAAAGLSNTPAFAAFLSANQSIANATYTKLEFETETYDSDGTYDNSSTYRFTPAVSGKYFIYACTRTATTTDFNALQILLRKNGSDVFIQTNRNTYYDSVSLACTFDSNTTDYFEIVGYQNSGGSINFGGGASDSPTRFGAYRIIGA